jgi:hypothetical protein
MLQQKNNQPISVTPFEFTTNQRAVVACSKFLNGAQLELSSEEI